MIMVPVLALTQVTSDGRPGELSAISYQPSAISYQPSARREEAGIRVQATAFSFLADS
jgi:hypothetical protein